MTTTEPVTVRRASTVDGRTLTVAVVSTAAAAWVGLWLMHGLPVGDNGLTGGAAPSVGPAHEHGTPIEVAPHYPGHAHPVGVIADPARWAAGWVVMVVAMMLPPALPLFRVVRRLVARRHHPGLLVGAAAVAFLSVWVAAGVAFALGDVALRSMGLRWPFLAANPQLVAGAAAVGAGLFQFSRVKKACLSACRSPLAMAMTTWTGRRSAAFETTHLGVRFGLVCVGCCWALMLLTFTVGVAAMPVMVVVGAVMALERLLPSIRPLVPLIGAQAIALGVLILIGVIPPGLGT